MATQVHVFVSGMNAGYQRFYLTRKTPSTLEEAFTVALREDYSVSASQAFDVSRPLVHDPEPEPMEVASYRCGKPGHRAAVGRAPSPMAANTTTVNDVAAPKNGGAGRPTGCVRSDGSLVTEPPPSPPVLHARLSATTSGSDSRRIVLRLHVEGAQRPIRALLDSGATNNFVRAASLPALPADMSIRESGGEMIVKYADGKPRRTPRRSATFAYEFDGFRSSGEFLVIELSGSFDCVFGIPWLARHQAVIDWLAGTVRPRDIDVNAVEAFLCGTPNQWPHVTVMDPDAMTHAAPEESDGPSCAHRFPRPDEQRFSEEDDDDVVEHGFPRPDEQWLSPGEDDEVVERGLPLAVEHGFPRVVERELPVAVGAAGQLAPRLGADVAFRHPESADVIEHGLSLSAVEDTPRPVARPPCDAAEITRLPGLSWKHFLRDLTRGEIEQVCMIVAEDAASIAAVETHASDSTSAARTRPKGADPKTARAARYAAQSLPALEAAGNPVAPLVREFSDIFPDKVPAALPPDRGVRHEIDLVPGAKYCVARQWPLPRDQAEAIDAFFEGRRRAGHVRESLSPHSSPTFRVKEATGGWRIVHAFNKLNDATIPAQTPIPRKDMVLDTMSGSTKFSAIDLMDGFYQILMREADVPLTAVSTPSGMLWEWLVMPQGLKNAPATFNRMVSNPLRPHRDFALSNFDDIFIHSRAAGGMTDVEMHLQHLRRVFEVMRENKVYANLKKCIFCAPEIPVLGSYVSTEGVRADPEKIEAICAWPVPHGPKQLRQWLGLATGELPVASAEAGRANYPVHDKELLAMRYALIKFRVYLLGEQTFAVYTDHASLRTATMSPHLSQRMARWLSLFSEYNFVVQYKPGKTNILADALSRRPDYVQSGRHAVGDEDDDGCAVCIAKEVAAVEVAATTRLRDLISAAYESDAACTEMIQYLRDPSDTARRRLSTRGHARIDRYQPEGNLLTYSADSADPPRIVVPLEDDLRARLIHKFHDAPSGGHLGREKPFASLSRDFYWPHMYKWVRKWVHSCEACQRVKPSQSKQAPLRPLPDVADPWSSVSMDFVFGLPRDAQGRTGIVVFVDRFSKMVHLAPVAATITAQQTAAIFLDIVYRHHGIPTSIVSDRDPRFTTTFWKELFKLVGTRLAMSTASHPETDGQTERANRVVEDVLRSFATSFRSRRSFVPMVEFAINNAEQASTGLTPFYINFGRHPRVPALLGMEHPIGPDGDRDDDTGCDRDHDETSARVNGVFTRHGTRSAARSASSRNRTTRRIGRGGEVAAPPPSNFLPNPEPQPRDAAAANAFLQQRESVMRYVRDAIATAVDRQKEYADQRGRKNLERFAVGDRVLLSKAGIQLALVTNLGASKLAPRYIGPFKILKVLGDAYMLQLPTALRLHPTFYVGRLQRYHPAAISSDADAPTAQRPDPGPSAAAPAQRSIARDEPPSVPSPGAPSAPARAAAAASPRPPPGGHAAQFRRDGPAPLVDSAGHERHIVEAVLGHDDSRRAVPQRARTGRGTRAHAGPIPRHRRYLVRWLGPMDDSWEPRGVLLADIPDCVEAYEASLPQGATPRRA
ncbi:unnamed protein product [Phytophthora fragariaefolia]|uniref:RNA-directed DNA polymerase n=1 Tax=Phytophthora fragariaefolia TaxID=1490495 RepID=A0A9W6XR71_9STRA|nr:unnamed protein product [Phytophthora fragariaefolia]